MNIEERRECIVKVFARYLYGHLLPLSFSASNGGWTDWANLVRRFTDSLQHPRNLKKYDFKSEVEKVQEEMVDFATISHSSRCYPVVPYFKERLYHRLRDLFEEVSWTMSNKLVTFLLEDKVEVVTKMLPNKNESTDDYEDIQMVNVESEYLFKTYEIMHGCPVTLIEENRDRMMNGTTGLISWQGAVALALWATESEIFNEKEPVSILELGSGLGLFGMTMLKMGHSFTFTDCHHAVLNFLVTNAKLNFMESELDKEALPNWINDGPPKEVTAADESKTDVKMNLNPERSQKLGIKYLNWIDFTAESLKDLKADVIMGSDLVYDLEILPGLASLIRNLLEINRGRKTVAYISCTHRKPKSMETFLSCIKSEKMQYEAVFRRTFSPSDCIMIAHEGLSTVSLFKISLAS